MKHVDRRVVRTRILLQQALLELIAAKGYDAVTIHDITERANVGRATFYLHYQSKDELFFMSHLKDMEYPYSGIFTKEELLAVEPPQSLIEIFRYARENRLLMLVLSGSKDSQIIMKQVKHQLVESLETSLKNAFPEADYSVSLDVLANYLAGSRMNLMLWWIESRAPQSPEEIVQICHRLQRAVIYETLGLVP